MAIAELYESRKETIGASGLVAQRKFIVDRATRFAESPKVGDPYPEMLGCYCKSIRFEPTGKPDGSGPPKCFVYADYSSADSAQQQSAEYEAESLDFGGEMIVKGGGFWETGKYDQDGNLVNAPVEENDPGAVAYYPRMEYVKTMVVDDITEWVKKTYKATSKLNSSTWLGGKAETWLFQGADAVKFVDQTGEPHWRITFRFVYRDTGWNKSWRKDDPEVGGKWDSILHTGKDGKDHYFYETTSFNTLLAK